MTRPPGIQELQWRRVFDNISPDKKYLDVADGMVRWNLQWHAKQEWFDSLESLLQNRKKADWAVLGGLPDLQAQVVDMPSFSTISLYRFLT
ncbi:MAG: hypothetical protein ACFFB7_02080, partial [Candidatus Sifarchaeia archaeon]